MAACFVLTYAESAKPNDNIQTGSETRSATGIDIILHACIKISLEK